MSPAESQHSLVCQAHQSLRIGHVERDHACQVGWRRHDDERGKITRKGVGAAMSRVGKWRRVASGRGHQGGLEWDVARATSRRMGPDR